MGGRLKNTRLASAIKHDGETAQLDTRLFRFRRAKWAPLDASGTGCDEGSRESLELGVAASRTSDFGRRLRYNQGFVMQISRADLPFGLGPNVEQPSKILHDTVKSTA